MAVYANLVIDQGSRFVSTINVEDGSGLPYPLGGYGARGQIRRTYKSTTSYPILCTVNRPNEGEIDITVPTSVTGVMNAGRYVYDIEIYNLNDPTDVTRVIEGQVEVTPRATY